MFSSYLLFHRLHVFLIFLENIKLLRVDELYVVNYFQILVLHNILFQIIVIVIVLRLIILGQDAIQKLEFATIVYW